MRSLQILLFFLGLIAFIAAIFFIGSADGDTLWRAGIAVILLDAVFIRLWPNVKS